MIDELDSSVEDQNDRVNAATKRTRELIAKTGGAGWFCVIVGLSAFLVFLIILILYT
jgi:hypothetical protein